MVNTQVSILEGKIQRGDEKKEKPKPKETKADLEVNVDDIVNKLL